MAGWRSTAIRLTAAGRHASPAARAAMTPSSSPGRCARPCPGRASGFTADDFTADEEQGTVTCPNGVTRQMSPARTVTFGAACAACPLRDLCTTAKDGRPMTMHPHEGLLRAARAHARTPEFKQACPTRSNIERTIAWIATQNGRRIKLRYIGTAKNDAWLHTRCAGLASGLAGLPEDRTRPAGGHARRHRRPPQAAGASELFRGVLGRPAGVASRWLRQPRPGNHSQGFGA